jgi:hypothetical protein
MSWTVRLTCAVPYGSMVDSASRPTSSESLWWCRIGGLRLLNELKSRDTNEWNMAWPCLEMACIQSLVILLCQLHCVVLAWHWTSFHGDIV